MLLKKSVIWLKASRWSLPSARCSLSYTRSPALQGGYPNWCRHPIFLHWQISTSDTATGWWQTMVLVLNNSAMFFSSTAFIHIFCWIHMHEAQVHGKLLLTEIVWEKALWWHRGKNRKMKVSWWGRRHSSSPKCPAQLAASAHRSRWDIQAPSQALPGLCCR